MPQPSERCYRIHYPIRERPALRMGEAEYMVLDVSETGVLFRQPAGSRPLTVGEEVEGVIRLRHGAEAPILGTILRIKERPAGGRDVALQFTGGGIPFGLVLEEQRYLRSRYPYWR